MKKIFLLALLFTVSLTMVSCGGDDDNTPAPKPTPAVDDGTSGSGNGGSGSNSGSDNGSGNSGSGTDVTPSDPLQPEKDNKMKLLAHYMPWFVKPTASGVWNHWTMSANSLSPDHSNLASHYTPLTEPYASDDEAVLDYQCLLMKYAGLDGVIIDYMGESGKNDFGTIAANTKKMVQAVSKAGLQFALCYDEQTALATGVFSDITDAKEQGRTDMRFIKNNYFSKPNYLKNNGRPVLLIFGPARVTGSSNWSYITEPLGSADVVVLNSHAGNYGSPAGEFLWVNKSPNYATAKNFDLYIGGAMPGFWDVYKAFGQGNGYTTYDREDGALFQSQLAAAKDAGLGWLQVSTWNDYGEGTTIEPTKEYAYQYLTILQQFAGVSCTQADLELVYRWFNVRKAKPSDSRVAQAYAFLAALQTDQAAKLINELE